MSCPAKHIPTGQMIVIKYYVQRKVAFAGQTHSINHFLRGKRLPPDIFKDFI